jgi:hypothetical protein
MVMSIQMPSPAGGDASYMVSGMGAVAEYRAMERVSGTLDVTSAMPGTSAMLQTIEVGTRIHTLPYDRALRPFFDVRAAYAHMSDLFTSSPVTGASGAPSQEFFQGQRYSSGYGGISGAGLEYSLTTRFSITTELAALRGRMTVYRMDMPTSIPANMGSYWMTSFRYSIGLRFTPTSVMHLK